MQRCSVIISVIFGWGGLIVVDIHRVDLVGLGEDLCWLEKIHELGCSNLVNLLEFTDVSHNFCCFG